MSPQLRSFLFFLFLGLPGLGLQILGVCGATWVALAISANSPLSAAILVLVSLLGFAIGSTMRLLSEASDHPDNPAAAKCPAEMAAEVAVKSLVLLSGIALTAGIILLGSGKFLASAFAGLLMILSGGGSLFIGHSRGRFRSRLEKPPPPRTPQT